VGIGKRKEWDRWKPLTGRLYAAQPSPGLGIQTVLSGIDGPTRKTEEKSEMAATKNKPVETEFEGPNVFDDAVIPYSVSFTVKGVKRFFFNAPNVDAYIRGDERRKAGVKRLHEPDYEEKVWRDDGVLCVPGNEFIKAMSEMSRGLPDPTKSGARSMRPIVPLAMGAHEEFCHFANGNGGLKAWDAIDERLGRLGTKMGPIRRPILLPGWETTVTIDVIWPEVFAPADIATLMTRAGQRGIGDATKIGYGRFIVLSVTEPSEISWT
jgi:hypothetical protein